MSSPETDRLHRSSPPRRPTGSGVAAGRAARAGTGSLHVSVRAEAEHDVVVLVGELDIATAPQLTSAIDRLLLAGRNRIVVDLDAVTFFDAAAINAVITATSAVAVSGGTLHVAHHPGFMRLLRFTLDTHRVNVAKAMQSDASDVAGDSVAPRSHGAGGIDASTGVGSDAELASLLRRSAGGDEEAFAVVYDVTAARAYGLGLRMLRDPVQAAEVVQEAYVHLWRNSAYFQSTDGSAVAWILRVVHRGAVRRARSTAERVAPDESDLRTVTGPPDGAAVEPLSTQAQVVELAYFEGCTHREVEAMTGLPVGTAQVRIRDGLLESPDRRGRR